MMTKCMPTHPRMSHMQVDVVKGDWCDPQGLDIQNATTQFAVSMNKTGKSMWFT